MADNRVVVYAGPGQVAIENTEYPKLEIPREVAQGLGIKQAAPHAVILKLVTTNICGSDQHMVRGRTTAPVGQTLGHEITGEIVEIGDDVLFHKVGDISRCRSTSPVAGAACATRARPASAST
jgi:glutathione-independent formaldehyde dehydrogenase